MNPERSAKFFRDLMHRHIHDGVRRLEDHASGGTLATRGNGQMTREGGSVAGFAGLAGEIAHDGRTVTVTVVQETSGDVVRIDDPRRHHAMDDSNVSDEILRWVDHVPTANGLHVIAGGRLSGRRTTLGFAIRRFVSQGLTLHFTEDPSIDVPRSDVVVHGMIEGVPDLRHLAILARSRPVLALAHESFRDEAFALAGRHSTDIFWLSQFLHLGDGGAVRLTAIASELRP